MPDERFTGPSGQITERTQGIHHHPLESCDDHPCPFHHPSEHALADRPMILRSSGLIERECIHGVGHPDPDSSAYFARLGQKHLGVHGCDGCCKDPLAVMGQKVDRISSIAEDLAES